MDINMGSSASTEHRYPHKLWPQHRSQTDINTALGYNTRAGPHYGQIVSSVGIFFFFPVSTSLYTGAYVQDRRLDIKMKFWVFLICWFNIPSNRFHYDIFIHICHCIFSIPSPSILQFPLCLLFSSLLFPLSSLPSIQYLPLCFQSLNKYTHTHIYVHIHISIEILIYVHTYENLNQLHIIENVQCLCFWV